MSINFEYWFNNLTDVWKYEVLANANLSGFDFSYRELEKSLKEDKSINIDNSQIDSLKPLLELTFLLSLSCSNCNIESLEGIEKLNLRYLDCSKNRITNLEQIKNHTNMNLLDLSYTLVESLESIRNLINITSLSFDNTLIDDLEPLENLIKLWCLRCEHTNVFNLKPILHLNELVELDIFKANVSTQEYNNFLDNSCMRIKKIRYK